MCVQEWLCVFGAGSKREGGDGGAHLWGSLYCTVESKETKTGGQLAPLVCHEEPKRAAPCGLPWITAREGKGEGPCWSSLQKLMMLIVLQPAPCGLALLKKTGGAAFMEPSGAADPNERERERAWKLMMLIPMG